MIIHNWQNNGFWPCPELPLGRVWSDEGLLSQVGMLSVGALDQHLLQDVRPIMTTIRAAIFVSSVAAATITIPVSFTALIHISRNAWHYYHHHHHNSATHHLFLCYLGVSSHAEPIFCQCERLKNFYLRASTPSSVHIRTQPTEQNIPQQHQQQKTKTIRHRPWTALVT